MKQKKCCTSYSIKYNKLYASLAPRRRPRLPYSTFCGTAGFIYAKNVIGTKLLRVRSDLYSFSPQKTICIYIFIYTHIYGCI